MRKRDIETIVKEAFKAVIFEPNDPKTWGKIVDFITRSISKYEPKLSFEVICNASTNTQKTIDRNEIHGYILTSPEKGKDKEYKFMFSNK